MKDSIIILSGGVDSTTMLYEYRDRIALAVSFDYGSNHNAKEIPFARYHCEQLRIPHIVIELGFMKQYFSSSLLQGAEAIPEGNYDEENMKSTVVPFRNGIMLSVAAGLAETHDMKYVMMANHAGDHTIYPDCRPEFVEALSAAICHGTYSKTEVFAPYTNVTKTEIVRRGLLMGIDYDKTWSCYKGGDTPCGQCGTCREREEALEQAKQQLNAKH